MKMSLKTAAFAAIAAFALNSASARTSPSPLPVLKPFAINFDASTGTGFVGKGDVQLAYGWNNAQLQQNARGITFTYNASESWEAVCSWTTGEGHNGVRTHYLTRNKTSTVSANIAYDARTMKQITGFNLTGFGSYTFSGDAMPNVGDACLGEGAGATYISVTPVASATGAGGGLYVNYNGVAVAMPNTPVL